MVACCSTTDNAECRDPDSGRSQNTCSSAEFNTAAGRENYFGKETPSGYLMLFSFSSSSKLNKMYLNESSSIKTKAGKKRTTNCCSNEESRKISDRKVKIIIITILFFIHVYTDEE